MQRVTDYLTYKTKAFLHTLYPVAANTDEYKSISGDSLLRLCIDMQQGKYLSDYSRRVTG